MKKEFLCTLSYAADCVAAAYDDENKERTLASVVTSYCPLVLVVLVPIYGSLWDL